MEPISLSLGAIVAGLVAKATDRATGDAVDGGVSVLRRLVSRLRGQLAQAADEEAGTALVRLEGAPDSPTRVEELAAALDRRSEADRAFRALLESLVDDARSAGLHVPSVTQDAHGNQNVQVAGVADSAVSVSYGSSRPDPQGRDPQS